MKKMILTTVFIGISILSQAQCELPYKPLSAFGKDTTAFIVYNFTNRADCYKGKTIKEIERDLQMPIIKYNYFIKARTKNGNILGLHLFYEYTFNKISGIKIYWTNITGVDEKIKKLRIESNYWGKEIYEIVKDFKIKAVEVMGQKKETAIDNEIAINPKTKTIEVLEQKKGTAIDDEFSPIFPNDIY